MKRYLLFFIFFAFSLHAQSRVEWVLRTWEIELDDLFDRVEALQVDALKQLEEAELEKTERLAYRAAILEQYRLRLKGNVPLPTLSGERVAFLGNSSNPLLESGFNAEVLGQLLDQIKLQKPKALFFLGNLIWSLEPPAADEKGKLVTLSPVYDSLGNVSYQPSGVFSKEFFRKRLAAFAEVLKQHLGNEIAFYPLVGESEAVGPDSVQILLEQFPVPNSTVLETGQLVYTVPIGKANFVAVSFPAYDSKTLVTDPLLKWLDKALLEAKEFPFRFAVGSVPAFSTGGASGAYRGLDRDRDARTRFWQILMKNNVLAYFCSNEPFYDRTYRYGVWQIITGGAGGEDENNDQNSFPHYLLLTIPESAGKAPLLEVFDLQGRKRDETALSSQIPAIFQYRE